MTKNDCLCLTCGRPFSLALESGANLADEACPFCGGRNLIRQNPSGFLESLFGGAGGT